MKIYISNYLSNSISVLDYQTFELEQEIKLEYDMRPHHFCVDYKNNVMYIPSSINGILYVLDLSNNKIIDTLSIGGSLSNIALHNEELFVTNEDTNSIYIIDANSIKPIGLIGVEEMPHGLDFDESNGVLYIPCKNSIVSIDTESKKVLNQLKSNFKTWHIKIDNNNDEIYTTTLDGELVIVDKADMKIKKIVNKFLVPVEVDFSYKNKRIYVADLGSKNIFILDYKTKEVLHKIKIDGYPQGLRVSPDEEYLFVSDTYNNSIKIYDTVEYTCIKEIRVGKEPTTILIV